MLVLTGHILRKHNLKIAFSTRSRKSLKVSFCATLKPAKACFVCFFVFFFFLQDTFLWCSQFLQNFFKLIVKQPHLPLKVGTGLANPKSQAALLILTNFCHFSSQSLHCVNGQMTEMKVFSEQRCPVAARKPVGAKILYLRYYYHLAIIEVTTHQKIHFASGLQVKL